MSLLLHENQDDHEDQHEGNGHHRAQHSNKEGNRQCRTAAEDQLNTPGCNLLGLSGTVAGGWLPLLAADMEAFVSGHHEASVTSFHSHTASLLSRRVLSH